VIHGWNRRSASISERGQSLVELSISMVIMLLLLFGLLDLGRAYFIFIAMEDSAGEAAVFLSLYPECLDASSGPLCGDPNNATYRAQNAASGYFQFFDWGDNTQLNVYRPPVYATGTTVRVEIIHTFDLLFPVIPDIVGANSITLRSEASHIIVSE
jgi:hypothetical protein